MNETILVAGGGHAQLYLVQALIALGKRIILVDRDPVCPCRELTELFINESTHDGGRWLTALRNFRPEIDIHGVLTSSSGPPVRALATVANALKIPLYSDAAAQLAISKIAFRRYFGGVHHANSSEFSRETNKRWPVVVKADYSVFGKNAVRWATNDQQLNFAINEIKKISLSGEVLVEQYVTGRDLIFVGLVRNGSLVFLVPLAEINKLQDDGKLRSIGIMGPVHVETEIRRYATLELTNIINKFMIINAPISLSVRASKKECVPIELHLDFGGESVYDWLLRPVFKDGIKDVLNLLFEGKDVTNTFEDSSPANCHAVLYERTTKSMQKIFDYKVELVANTGTAWQLAGASDSLERLMRDLL